MSNLLDHGKNDEGFDGRQHLFEALDGLGRRSSDRAATAILFELISPGEANRAQRVFGADYAEAMVGGALRMVAARIAGQAQVYHVDPLSFAVLVPASGEVDATIARLRAWLAEPLFHGDVPILADPAIGTYAFTAGEVVPREVLNCLVSAVGDARESGTGLAAYGPHHGLRQARNLMLAGDLRKALPTTDQLSLVYQPRIAMASGVCTGAEALLRWRHPMLGQVQPGDFIPAIELTALARPLTDWVIAAAMAQQKAWLAKGVTLRLSINAFARDLDDPDFAERLVRIADEARVPPRLIELEFTEAAVADAGARAVERLSALRGFGIEIAIDDFGSAGRGLAHLRRLPCSVLRIAPGLVTKLDESARDRRLVRATIAMARDLGYRIAAKGIETEGVHHLLSMWGCDEGQGFLIAEPLPAAGIAEWTGLSLDRHGARTVRAA